MQIFLDNAIQMPSYILFSPCDWILLLFLIIHAQLQEVKMQTWVELVQNNVGSIELDADQFNFGAMPEEEEHIEVVAEASPPLKMGNKNKKRSRNFSEKEDMLLVSAWLEISLNLVQNIDQTRDTYGHRIHEYYNKHKTFDSDRNVSSLSLSLSHRWGIIQASVSKFCSWYNQVLRSNQSDVPDQDKDKV
jgi:hypothetical protein